MQTAVYHAVNQTLVNRHENHMRLESVKSN